MVSFVLLRLLSLILCGVKTVESQDTPEMDVVNFDEVADVNFDAEPVQEGLPPKVWNLKEHRRTATQIFKKYKKHSKLHMIERILEPDEVSTIVSTLGDREFSRSPDLIDSLPSHMIRLNVAQPCNNFCAPEEVAEKLQKLVTPIVHTRLLPLIKHRYDCKDCTVCNIAFRRYAAGELGQRASLQTHYDDAYFATAEIGLDVQGLEYDGGLYIEDEGERKVVALKTGDAMYHQYDLPHGVDVQEGRRTSMIVQFQDSSDCVPDHARWYLKASKKGDPVAKFQLGQLFQVGTSKTPKDLMKALRLFEASHEKGYPKAGAAMAQLLLSMENTAEVPRDEELAVKVLKESSEGSADSAYLLAQHLLHTQNADHKEAVKLLTRAAESPQSLPISAYALGNLYLGQNDAVDKDMQKALTWWRLAGSHGFTPAMGNVGAFHLNEVLESLDAKEKQGDIASKAKEADKWLRPAAMSGYGPAMYSLGVLDLKYNKKVESALQWLEKAKNAGHEQAKIEFDAVRELRGNAEKKQAHALAATGKQYV
jgi:TPR repeat protein